MLYHRRFELNDLLNLRFNSNRAPAVGRMTNCQKSFSIHHERWSEESIGAITSRTRRCGREHLESNDNEPVLALSENMDSSHNKAKIQNFINQLSSSSEDERENAVQDLRKFVTSELLEMSPDDANKFIDEFGRLIYDMTESNDLDKRKGGICAIIVLVSTGDFGRTSATHSRFFMALKQQTPLDAVHAELTAYAMGKATQALPIESADSVVESRVNEALEWLNRSSIDRSHGERRYLLALLALFVLREISVASTSFIKAVKSDSNDFFEQIFKASRSKNVEIREASMGVLRATFSIIASREGKEQNIEKYYEKCLEEALAGFNIEPTNRESYQNREDRIHGCLMIIYELLRCSSLSSDMDRQEELISSEFASKGYPAASTSLKSLKYTITKGLSTVRNSYGTLSYIPPGHGLKGLADVVNHHREIGVTPGLSMVIKPEPQVKSFKCKQLLEREFNSICQEILRDGKEYKGIHVQNLLLFIIPRLAAFDRTNFTTKAISDPLSYLDVSVNFILQKCREIKLRSNAFFSLGLLALAVKDDIYPYVPRIFVEINSSLPPKGTSRRQDDSIFTCISLLAESLGERIKDQISQLLDSLFLVLLSSSQTNALRNLSINIPALSDEIQRGSLRMLEKLLIKPSDASSTNDATVDTDPKRRVLALEVLRKFDLQDKSLLKFLSSIGSDEYIVNSPEDVKLAAVQTCCCILSQAMSRCKDNPSFTLRKTCENVLSRLLEVAVTDTSAAVRYSVLAMMDVQFDVHLKQVKNLNALFLCLNEECFEVRELCVCIIGRLSILNPACVMPHLRICLLEYLTDIEHSGLNYNREQSTRMLNHLIFNAPELIKPYTEPIIQAFKPLLSECKPYPSVVINVLSAIGALAQVAGPDMKIWVDDLFPSILDNVQDASSLPKREVGLWALGEIVCYTGTVVDPYRKYPDLIEILFSFLRSEQSPNIKREIIRLLGLLGAIDPYKHKVNLGVIDNSGDSLIAVSDSRSERQDLTAAELLVSMSNAQEEFYIAISISTLMKVMKDSSQVGTNHVTAVQALLLIFTYYRSRCVPYIPQVLPVYLSVIRSAESAHKEFLFQKLGELISIVNNHIRNFLNDIFLLIEEHWGNKSSYIVQVALIDLIEQIVIALGAEFKLHVPHLIPHFLRVFDFDSSPKRSVTGKMLAALQQFGSSLDENLHIILPRVICLLDSEVDDKILSEALETIDRLSDTLDITRHASRIVHTTLRIVKNNPSLREQALTALASLTRQMGHRFTIYVPMVNRVLTQCNYYPRESQFSKLLDSISRGEMLPDVATSACNLSLRRRPRTVTKSANNTSASVRKEEARFDFQWPHNDQGEEEWREWFKSFSNRIITYSPNLALRSCSPLAKNNPQITRDLFCAAFLALWCGHPAIDSSIQREMEIKVERILEHSHVPSEISQTFLNLSEFMEHSDRGPITAKCKILADRAIRCRAFAKALHYREEEFHQDAHTTELLESLISINNKLQQPEAATGVVKYATKRNVIKIKERWYEKLHEWENALNAYKQKTESDPNDLESKMGVMRCYAELGEWGNLYKASADIWPLIDHNQREKMARIAASAAWGLGAWDDMSHYTMQIKENTADRAMFSAVHAIHRDQFRVAQELIDQGRKLIQSDLTSMAGESYSRAYGALVQVMMLSELEEVIEYKKYPNRQAVIREKWWRRLQGCQRVVEDWQKILQVRTLVLKPHDDIRTWLKFAALCQKSSRFQTSNNILCMLMNCNPAQPPVDSLLELANRDWPQVTFAYIKHLWKDSASLPNDKRALRKDEVYNHLTQFVSWCQPILREEAMSRSIAFAELDKLLSRCYLKLGQWHENLHGLNEKTIPCILTYYLNATKCDQEWYKAWHSYAYMNYEAVLYLKQQQQQAKVDTSGSMSRHQSATAAMYTVSAVRGFFKSVTLARGSSLQDTLRLLTLWFEEGQSPEVYEALSDGIKLVPIETWLQVIPQLIARIDTPRHLIGRLIHQLLIDIGKQHPQALIYPLTVAAKSSVTGRSAAANKILTSMRENNATLVNQAILVSDELIRVAILWHELWYEALEEASRLYFGEKNAQGMFDTLNPLHEQMKRGPQTLKEKAFEQAYGRDLEDAHDFCLKFQASINPKNPNGNQAFMMQAWDLYYNAFRRINKQLPQLTSLELQYVSPRLLKCRDLELAVPGSYNPNQPVIRIARVEGSLAVITSKQRPRRLVIKGSNGKDFMFLLKGHEDLRQDERVMQLFGLVNTLLVSEPETSRRNLAIQRYAVIPLSTNSGLIGWVPHCDTLHTLIRDYREKKNVLLNIEHRIMTRMAPDYDHITLMQKVEVFEHALANTNGDDLSRLLWLNSPSSEVWFERRTNFTRSLAVMSMVGYVLGLGDRHPSNLMLDRLSGKIVHIDFGDCFEIAMTREKFPEKIPFRLTRMLIHAMEVTGIEGTYRITCEKVMRVLRNNKDSLMAVLEAFVYDPLLTWRLVDANQKNKHISSKAGHPGTSVTGATDADLVDQVTNESVRSANLTSTNVISGEGRTEKEAPKNKKAVAVVNRVRDKLTGRDFDANITLNVNQQVDLLIHQATSHENLCQCYIGWCPFW